VQMSWQFVMFMAAFCSGAYFLREAWRSATSPEFLKEVEELERDRRHRQIERDIAEYKRRHGGH
jgi:hypothetical protein